MSKDLSPMADDPKDNQPAPGADSSPPPAAGPEAPAPDDAAAKSADATAAGQNADALADGTVPTVLKPGTTKITIPKGKTSLTRVYRRADIITTLVTFAGAVVAGGLIIGGYYYFVVKKNQPATAPKVTSLDKTELEKLGAFFEGNSAGSSAQVLTVNSSSLFNNRVAVSSDLKVLGALEASGTTTLGGLNVNKTSTLGVTNVRGALSVDGPLTVQNSAIFNAGGTFKGNLTTTGSGSFGGSLSAGSITTPTLSVSGALNINGHINIGGQTPTASSVSGVSTNAHVQGNDAAGSVSVSVSPHGGHPGGVELMRITFRANYPVVPVIVITPVGRNSAIIDPYITATASGFTISAANLGASGSATTYSFNYWVVQ